MDPTRPSPAARRDRAHAPVPSPWELQRFIQAVAEVLANQRRPQQLRARMDALAYHRLSRAVGYYRGPTRPRTRTARIYRPTSQSVEVCAVVHCGHRFRALALRVEVHGDQWRCTRLQTA
ncbi:Rv3235 family protein [Lipingzhangella sp. LS1_29]|uniref:Rv3235 family protein n=1 Tax=Lipingzhangella rawalii TaxID=2055835 RepID=A0ABU2HCN7_9ACTN|nr:Rv3235 family protein [Lipingzhangella rawalii]MDS1272619.1 Rv3235 family protein [Lipingzhangella rawalii]